eukprot:scaffold12.g8049.t1
MLRTNACWVAAAWMVPEVRPGVRCPTGQARITPGGNLPAKHVIHTVGPVYHSDAESAPLLDSAYRSSLRLANERGLTSLAFPAISCGVFGYPLAAAAKIAVAACKEEAGALEEISFFLFGDRELDAWASAADVALPRAEEPSGEPSGKPSDEL